SIGGVIFWNYVGRVFVQSPRESSVRGMRFQAVVHRNQINNQRCGKMKSGRSRGIRLCPDASHQHEYKREGLAKKFHTISFLRPLLALPDANSRVYPGTPILLSTGAPATLADKKI